MVVRQTIEEIVQRKNLIIAAVHANPNWDGEDNAAQREEYLTSIEKNFNRVVIYIRDPAKLKRDKEEQEKAMQTPFWDAARRGMERQQLRLRGIDVEDDNTTVDTAMQRQRSADQNKPRPVRRSYDQI